MIDMPTITRFPGKRPFGARTVSLFLIFLFMAAQVWAGEWYLEPVVSMQLGYNDNTQLSVNNKIETSTSTVTGDAVFGFRTEVSDVSLGARMVDERFDNHADLNSNDQYLTFKSSYRSELDQFGFDAGYDRVSTRTSEFNYSGYSTSEGYRITKAVRPYWARTLTERTSLRLDGAYSEATYEDTTTSSLTNYTNKSVNISLQHKLSERTSLQTVVGKTLYESDSTEYDTSSIRFGIDHMLSETLKVNMLLGPSYTNSKFFNNGAEEESSDVGKLITLGFSKEFERTTLSGALNTSESAGGEGKLIKSTGLSLSLQRRISDRTSFGLTASAQQNESGGGISDKSSDRTYVNFAPKLSWKATPWLTVTGSYSYQRSEYTSSDEGPAESNAVYLGLEYVWPK